MTKRTGRYGRMSKSVTVPILNHEYKVVVCWGDLKHLRKTLLEHHYSPDHVTTSYLKEQAENRRGVTFREHRCHPVIWLNGVVQAAEAIGTLAHEAVHAVDFTFESIEETLHHSEVFAHSVGAIVREAIKAMKILPTKPFRTPPEKKDK